MENLKMVKQTEKDIINQKKVKKLKEYGKKIYFKKKISDLYYLLYYLKSLILKIIIIVFNI